MDGSRLETSKSSNISNKDWWFLNGPNQKRVYGVVCTSYAQKKWSTKKIKQVYMQHVCGFKRWCFNVCKRNNPPLCTCLNGLFPQLFGGYPTPKPSHALTRSMFALLIIAMCRTRNHQKVLMDKIWKIKTLKVSLMINLWLILINDNVSWCRIFPMDHGILQGWPSFWIFFHRLKRLQSYMSTVRKNRKHFATEPPSTWKLARVNMFQQNLKETSTLG